MPRPPKPASADVGQHGERPECQAGVVNRTEAATDTRRHSPYTLQKQVGVDLYIYVGHWIYLPVFNFYTIFVASAIPKHKKSTIKNQTSTEKHETLSPKSLNNS